MPVNGQCLRCVRLRCESNGQDPENCPVSDILDFLQQRMDDGSMPSTLKVYVAAILAFHAAINGRPVGKYDLIIRFLRGARRPFSILGSYSSILGFGSGAGGTSPPTLRATSECQLEGAVT